MPDYKLEPPTVEGKRYSIVTPEGRRINFGSKGGSTFIDHKDERKKAAWMARHSKLNENWAYSGRNTAGFYARWLLWSEPTLEASIRKIRSRFGIHIKR